MKIGIFGGTFNPIHEGHLHALASCREAVGLDRVLVIPTKMPPHKRPTALAPDADRLAMCRIATAALPWVEVSDCEIRRGGLSYTSDTLTELRTRFPEDELFLLVGGDMFRTLDTWHESGEIARLATVVGLARESGEYRLLERKREALTELGFRTLIVRVPPLPISSTEVRAGRRDGVPEPVAAYINEKGLYRTEKRCE